MSKLGFKLTLQTRFVIFVSMTFILIISAISYYYIVTEIQHYKEVYHDKGIILARTLAANSEYGVLILNRDILLSLVQNTIKEKDVVYAILENADGKVLSSAGMSGNIPLPASYAEKRPISQSKDPEPAISSRDLGGKIGLVYDIAFPIITNVAGSGIAEEEMLGLMGGKGTAAKATLKTIGMARIGISLIGMNAAITAAMRATLLISFASIIVGIFFSLLLFSMISGPLNYLLEGTNKLASGDLAYRVKYTRDDEIGALARSFNDMAKKLFDARKEITEYSTDLEKKVEQRARELQESETRFSSVLDQATETIIVHDSDGRIIEANQEAFRELGYTMDELLKLSIADIDPEAITSGKGELWGKVLSGERFTFESRHKRKDGTFYPVEISLGRIVLGNKTQVIAMVRDITDRKKSEEETRKHLEETKKLYEDLKSIDKMKTEFLSVISHELRTPLTPIIGYITMFISETFGHLDPKYIQKAEIIKKESEHLHGLIESLLDVSRLERGVPMQPNKEPLSILTLLEELKEVMKPQFDSRKMTLEIKLQDGFPAIMADVNKIRRLITNLLGNALKYVPAGGGIIIKGTYDETKVRIEMIDNGIGIENANLKKIFDKFFQVDGTYTRAAGGVGLGLAIAREIVTSHGGKIWAESDGLGAGSRFIFTLPIA